MWYGLPLSNWRYLLLSPKPCQASVPPSLAQRGLSCSLCPDCWSTQAPVSPTCQHAAFLGTPGALEELLGCCPSSGNHHRTRCNYLCPRPTAAYCPGLTDVPVKATSHLPTSKASRRQWSAAERTQAKWTFLQMSALPSPP